MARRGTGKGTVTLPWEPRGSLVRDLLSGRGIRLVPVVLGIAGLVAFLGWNHARERDLARTADAIDRTHRAVAHFRADMGRCPSSLRELVHPPRTGARYLESEPVDAWGHRLWVRCPGRYDPQGEDVVSAGPSGSFLSDDNVW